MNTNDRIPILATKLVEKSLSQRLPITNTVVTGFLLCLQSLYLRYFEISYCFPLSYKYTLLIQLRAGVFTQRLCLSKNIYIIFPFDYRRVLYGYYFILINLYYFFIQYLI